MPPVRPLVPLRRQLAPTSLPRMDAGAIPRRVSPPDPAGDLLPRSQRPTQRPCPQPDRTRRRVRPRRRRRDRARFLSGFARGGHWRRCTPTWRRSCTRTATRASATRGRSRPSQTVGCGGAVPTAATNGRQPSAHAPPGTAARSATTASAASTAHASWRPSGRSPLCIPRWPASGNEHETATSCRRRSAPAQSRRCGGAARPADTSGAPRSPTARGPEPAVQRAGSSAAR